MTDCERAEIRDVLPDLVAGMLTPAEAARVETHVATCSECAAEVALLRTARSLRPVAPAIDVARIVARLPRPAVSASVDRTVVSLDAHRQSAAARSVTKTSRWQSRSVWRAAATIGVMLVGGWSVLIVRSGGIGMVATGRGDSTQLTDSPAPVAVAPVASPAPAPDTTAASQTAADRRVSVSFGSLADYSDEELQAVLDRLDKWDGATSTEATTTTPILPVKGDGGAN